jgi:hypothetical protein
MSTEYPGNGDRRILIARDSSRILAASVVSLLSKEMGMLDPSGIDVPFSL